MNQDSDDPDSVRRSVTVEADQHRAFGFFVGRMNAWWTSTHRLGAAPFVDLVVEPREGGRWFERDAGGHECEWGRVLVWAPYERLVLDWQIDADWRHDPGLHTEVEVRFVVVDDSTTRVELEHRGLQAYGEHVDDVRAQLGSTGGWQGLLDAFGTQFG